MKRRQFLGAPVALLGLGLVGTYSRTAQAGEAAPAKLVLLRLGGSGADVGAASEWQDAWPQIVPNVRRGRVLVETLVKATSSSLGAVNVESAFFGADGQVNTALVFVSTGNTRDSGSRAMTFHVEAPHFGGFVITPTGAGARVAPSVVSLGDTRSGLLSSGRYVLLHQPSTLQRFSVSEYAYSGSFTRPLRRRDGRPVSSDYLVFEVGSA
jgi:hypothetical protein